MSKELRFDGKTAIVTGAGGNPSLGRVHAMLLAARGANVVVNDIGMAHAPGPATAQGVVDEIKALGGKAVANANSVATPEGAAAIVKTALDAYGSVDIVVNNAGIVFNVPFEQLADHDYEKVIDVNLMGPIWVSKAAWPHMKKKNYGRIVNITSGSMFGFAQQASYAASKGGVLSLTRALAAEGERFGIKVNAVSPAGFTRMVIGSQEEDCPTYQGTKNYMLPELVSPAVAYLAHEDCPVTGECLDVMGGAVKRVYFMMTNGIMDRELTIEKVADRWDEIFAGTAEGRVPISILDGYTLKNKPYTPSKKAG
jgi:NAD(P)-dependent dehydrogenase (short-subunit alcohol dehydrogenase family)